ncbi:MAG: hypothetical protein BRD57_01865, partial [Proteobacteria bacterium SW_6_67_9]
MPQKIVEKGSVALANGNALAVAEDYVFVGDDAGVRVVEVSTRSAPEVVGGLDLGGAIKDVALEGDQLVAVSGDEVFVIDVASPAAPSLVGQTEANSIKQLALRGDHAYAAAGSSGSGFAMVDLTDPANPVVTDPFSSRNFVGDDIVIFDDFAFIADRLFVSAIPYVNLEIAGDPRFQGAIDMSQYRDDDCGRVDADGQLAVCPSGDRLYITQYRQLADNQENPPTVEWRQPEPGTQLNADRPYRLRAEASDDVRVAQVDFYANGELVHSDTSRPYTYVHHVPEGAEKIDFRANALDLASNSGSTGQISFNVA